MIPLNGKGKFLQGIYRPKNPQKYVGVGTILYRSSWELSFFRWCDNNPNVLEWASESVVIKYQNPLDGKAHSYYTDGVLAIKEGDVITKYIIEIKPSQQLTPPKPTKKQKKKNILYEAQRFIVNQAKWNAAKSWCDQHKYKFLILTEKELFPTT